MGEEWGRRASVKQGRGWCDARRKAGKVRAFYERLRRARARTRSRLVLVLVLELVLVLVLVGRALLLHFAKIATTSGSEGSGVSPLKSPWLPRTGGGCTSGDCAGALLPPRPFCSHQWPLAPLGAKELR